MITILTQMDFHIMKIKNGNTFKLRFLSEKKYFSNNTNGLFFIENVSSYNLKLL